MAAQVDEKSLPNDKFGYRIYGVMAHLPLRQANEVRRLHRMLGITDLATEPHCSIDNFWGPPDLDAVKAALREVAPQHPVIETRINFSDLRKGQWGAAFGLDPVPDLMTLQKAVQGAMLPLTRRIREAGGNYWPHTTVILDAKPGEVDRLDEMLPRVSIDPDLRFESIELIGRIGPSRGRDYQILESFPLGG